MSTTVNRREDLLEAAIIAFVDRGYEGTSVADLAEATNLSKAAFVYHFSSKEDLLFELAGPLLRDLDELADRYADASEARDLTEILSAYLDVLCTHHQVVEWLDGDKSVLNHGDLGGRLDSNNRRFHEFIAGGEPNRINRAQASGVLGMLWRPVRNGYLVDDRDCRSAVLDAAVAAANMID